VTNSKPKQGIVVVTGANGEIGSETCRELARIGYEVHAVTRRPHHFKGDHSDRIQNVQIADITDVKQVAYIFSNYEKYNSRVVGLVCAAARFDRHESFEAISRATWMEILEVNLYGTFLWNQQYAKFCRQNGQEGSIVNITSQAAFTGGYTSISPYAASKGGITSLSKSLARELARDSIRVNCLAPGFIDTESMRGVLDQSALDQFRSRVPIGRLGTVREVARAIAFLLGQDSSYVTGSTLDISGGQLMH